MFNNTFYIYSIYIQNKLLYLPDSKFRKLLILSVSVSLYCFVIQLLIGDCKAKYFSSGT